MVSALQWADDLLSRLGAPVNTPNEELLVAWQQGEATKATYNPLATTVSSRQPGESNFNSIGVKNFPNYQAGLDATVKTIRNGRYPTILTGLLVGDASLATSAPAQFDTWGTGGSRVKSLLARTIANWPAAGAEQLPSMPGSPGSVDTSRLAGGMGVKSPGLGDVPGALGGIASAGAGGLTGLLSDPLRQTIVFVTLLGGALGLILIGAKRTADPILPKVPPGAMAAMAA